MFSDNRQTSARLAAFWPTPPRLLPCLLPSARRFGARIHHRSPSGVREKSTPCIIRLLCIYCIYLYYIYIYIYIILSGEPSPYDPAAETALRPPDFGRAGRLLQSTRPLFSGGVIIIIIIIIIIVAVIIVVALFTDTGVFRRAAIAGTPRVFTRRRFTVPASGPLHSVGCLDGLSVIAA